METIASNPCLDYILVNFNHNNLIIASNISLEYIILVNFHLYFKTIAPSPCLEYILVNFNHNNLIIASNIIVTSMYKSTPYECISAYSVYWCSTLLMLVV